MSVCGRPSWVNPRKQAGDLLSCPPTVLSRASIRQFSEDTPTLFAKNAKEWGTAARPSRGCVWATWHGIIEVGFKVFSESVKHVAQGKEYEIRVVPTEIGVK